LISTLMLRKQHTVAKGGVLSFLALEGVLQ